MIGASADGVVVGTAIVNAVANVLGRDGKTTADPAEAVATLVSGLAAGVRARPPCSCPIVTPCLSPSAPVRSRGIEAMNWITNYVRPKINSMLGRRDMPENLWIKDPETGEMVFHKDLEENQFVIPASGHHMRIVGQGAAEVLLRRRQIRTHRESQGRARSAEIPRREALCRPAARRQGQDRPG